jgi:hypothetical protein
MIKRSQTLKLWTIIPFSSYLSPLVVGQITKNELDRTIDSFHNTHMCPSKAIFPRVPATM